MPDDFMSQEEIDALMKGDSVPEAGEAEEAQVNALDELTDVEQDTLAEIGNISMGSAATALSTLVNRRVNITVPDVYVSTPNSIQENYPVPCLVVTVEYVEGLSGSNLLVIKQRDAAVIGNLMMGEDGTNPPEVLDELYLSAVTEAMNMMMGSASTSMSDLFQYRIDISPPRAESLDLGVEELDFFTSTEPMAVVAFRIVIGDLVDSTMLQIIDLSFAKGMVAQLMEESEEMTTPEPAVEEDARAAREDGGTEGEANADGEGQSVSSWDDLKALAGSAAEEPPFAGLPMTDLGNINVDLIRDIPVQVRVILGRTNMSIENILKLGPGHMMELDTLEGEPIDVYANDTLIARGEVVVVGEQFGIRITEITTPKNRIDSIR